MLMHESAYDCPNFIVSGVKLWAVIAWSQLRRKEVESFALQLPVGLR